MSDVRRLPFDQYQRYRLVADLLARVAGPRPHVLDVGGGTGLLREFLPEARVTLVDVVPGGARGDLCLGDGSRLPLVADAVDAVCAFDTLEHVPPDRREPFLDECRRVSRRWICLAGPYHTPEVRAAEESLDAFLRERLELEHEFLAEHLDHGLPDRARTEARLGEGGTVRSYGHGNLELWQTLMRLEITVDEPHLLELGRALFELYARDLYARDHVLPVYRHAVLADLGGGELPEVGDVLGAPGDGEGGPVRRTLESALAVFAEDGERRAWIAERAEFRRTVDELRTDLEGHRAVLADREAQLAEHKRVMGELEDRVRELWARTPEGRLKTFKRRFLGGGSTGR